MNYINLLIRKMKKTKTVKIPVGSTGFNVKEGDGFLEISFSKPHEPKIGEILVWNETHSAPIIGFFVGGKSTTGINCRGKLMECGYGDWIFRPAKEEERQQLLEVLAKNRMWWNPKSTTVERIAPKGGDYVKLDYPNAVVYAKIRAVTKHCLHFDGWLSPTDGAHVAGGEFRLYDNVIVMDEAEWLKEVREIGYTYNSVADRYKYAGCVGDYIKFPYGRADLYCRIDRIDGGIYTYALLPTRGGVINAATPIHLVNCLGDAELLSESEWKSEIAKLGYSFDPNSRKFNREAWIPRVNEKYYTPKSTNSDMIVEPLVWTASALDSARLKNGLAFKRSEDCKRCIELFKGTTPKYNNNK